MCSLGRWASGSLQALAVITLSFAALGCAPANHGRPAVARSRIPPDTIVIRTERFTFPMGARVDPTWPAKAEETRDALGADLAELMEHEDTAVPVLSRQLGVTWPEEPLAFDVALDPGEGPAANDVCQTKLGRLVRVHDRRVVTPRPSVFFACILDRAFTELADKSTLHRALLEARPADGERLYACVRRFAVWAVVVARRTDEDEARVVESARSETCSAHEVAWLGKEWVKRVREEESPMDFALRLVGEEAAAPK